MAIPGVWIKLQCGPSNTHSADNMYLYTTLSKYSVWQEQQEKGTKVRKANMAVITHRSQGIAMVTGLPHTGNLDKTCQRLSYFTLSVRKPRSKAVLNHREQRQCLSKRWTEAWRHWSRPQGRVDRVKLGSCCSVFQREGRVVSVGGVHREVSKQTRVINKSEVYSHYLGLLFCHILGGWGWQRHNKRRAEQGRRKKQKDVWK